METDCVSCEVRTLKFFDELIAPEIDSSKQSRYCPEETRDVKPPVGMRYQYFRNETRTVKLAALVLVRLGETYNELLVSLVCPQPI